MRCQLRRISTSLPTAITTINQADPTCLLLRILDASGFADNHPTHPHALFKNTRHLPSTSLPPAARLPPLVAILITTSHSLNSRRACRCPGSAVRINEGPRSHATDAQGLAVTPTSVGRCSNTHVDDQLQHSCPRERERERRQNPSFSTDSERRLHDNNARLPSRDEWHHHWSVIVLRVGDTDRLLLPHLLLLPLHNIRAHLPRPHWSTRRIR